MNSVSAARPVSVRRKKNLFFVRCAVRRPCAEIFFFVRCYFFCPVRGSWTKKFSAGQLRLHAPRYFFLSGAIFFVRCASEFFFLSGAGLRGARRQPGEASENLFVRWVFLGPPRDFFFRWYFFFRCLPGGCPPPEARKSSCPLWEASGASWRLVVFMEALWVPHVFMKALWVPHEAISSSLQVPWGLHEGFSSAWSLWGSHEGFSTSWGSLGPSSMLRVFTKALQGHLWRHLALNESSLRPSWRPGRLHEGSLMPSSRHFLFMKSVWGPHESFSSSWRLPGALMKASRLHEGSLVPHERISSSWKHPQAIV